MRVLFVRHADAVKLERLQPGRADLARPLTSEGKAKARRAFKWLARQYDPPELIISSAARRAMQTAKLLRRAFGTKALHTSSRLNPGATYGDVVAVLQGRNVRKRTCVALVGHEPDISEFLAIAVAHGRLRVDIRKASCVVLEWAFPDKPVLLALFPPYAERAGARS